MNNEKIQSDLEKFQNWIVETILKSEPPTPQLFFKIFIQYKIHAAAIVETNDGQFQIIVNMFGSYSDVDMPKALEPTVAYITHEHKSPITYDVIITKKYDVIAINENGNLSFNGVDTKMELPSSYMEIAKAMLSVSEYVDNAESSAEQKLARIKSKVQANLYFELAVDGPE